MKFRFHQKVSTPNGPGIYQAAMPDGTFQVSHSLSGLPETERKLVEDRYPEGKAPKFVFRYYTIGDLQ